MDEVHAPVPKRLGALRCEVIERPLVRLRLVGLEPAAAQHVVKKLHSCHAGEVIVAGAGLAYGSVALDFARRLWTTAWRARGEGTQGGQHGFDTRRVGMIDALASDTSHRHKAHLAQRREV